MSIIAKTMYTGALSLGIMIAGFSPLSVHSQSKTADSFNFDELSAGGRGNWNFLSEDETVSIRDNLNNLREYDISGRENFDIRVIGENRRRLGIKRWGNRGDRLYYPLEDRIFPFYSPENRIYNNRY